jgi:hypothetical protein
VSICSLPLLSARRRLLATPPRIFLISRERERGRERERDKGIKIKKKAEALRTINSNIKSETLKIK